MHNSIASTGTHIDYRYGPRVCQGEAGCLGAGRLGADTGNLGSSKLLFYQCTTLINPTAMWGVVIFISRTQFMSSKNSFFAGIQLLFQSMKHHFHQHNVYPIRILCMNPAPGSAIVCLCICICLSYLFLVLSVGVGRTVV